MITVRIDTCLCMFLAKWKCDDYVQWGLRECGGSGKHPVLDQLRSEAQRVSHLCGRVPRLGCSRPKERPLRSVSTVPEIV